MFKVGESAVYPAHGIAIIKRIDERDIGGRKKSFYVLQVIENQMTFSAQFEGNTQTLTAAGSGGSGATFVLLLDGLYARGVQ